MSLDFEGHVVTIRYSEDFRKNKIVSEVYGRLRDNGLDPRWISTNYDVGLDGGKAKYMFLSDVKLPDRSEIEEILQGINLTELKIEDAVVAQG